MNLYNILKQYKNNYTICAPITPAIKSAISIVRVSGRKSEIIRDKIFYPYKKKCKPFNVVRGVIVNPDNKNIMDDVLCVFYPKSKSYTGESLCEFYLHGSVTIVNNFIKILTLNGCVLAEPGEFTFRAFVNGKVDLYKSEYIYDLVNNTNISVLRNSVKIVTGKFNILLTNIKNLVIELSSVLMMSVNFTENDVNLFNNKTYISRISTLIGNIEGIIKSSNFAKHASKPFKVVFLGEPNVGKSSLMNSILGYENSIVYNLPGTTRDIIESSLSLNNCEILLTDTAGIRTRNTSEIEKIGIEKTRRTLTDSNLNLLLLDASENKNFRLQHLRNLILRKKSNFCFVKTKIDLITNHLPFNTHNCIHTSSKMNWGIDAIKNYIINESKMYTKKISLNLFLTNDRHINSLKKIRKFWKSILSICIFDKNEEVLIFYLQRISSEIDKITGNFINEKILKSIFSKFCIGK